MGYDVDFVATKKEDFSNSDKRCRHILTDWLRTSYGPAPKTWQTLLSKLKDVESLKAAVESIEEELIEQHKLQSNSQNF